jgi:hypothetical protein
MIADLRLPMVDCVINEIRRAKFETRERAAEFGVSSFDFPVSAFASQSTIGNSLELVAIAASSRKTATVGS